MRPFIALTLVLIGAVQVSAQSTPPRFGVEGGVLYATVDGSDFEGTSAGMGFQIQGRLLLQGVSLGAGLLRTSHAVEGSTDNLVVTGFLFEPRYTFPTASSPHPFVNARFGFLTNP
jgi:hypothetical protein